MTFDTVLFSTIMYYMMGLAGRSDPQNFFVYMSLLLVFMILMAQQLAIFASFANASMLNAYSACVVFLLILFCGFLLSPASIPNYLACFYYASPSSWIYRALIVNEFRSDRWSPYSDQILRQNGYVGLDGVPFRRDWVGYAFAFAIPYSLLCMTLTALGLTHMRPTGGSADGHKDGDTGTELDVMNGSPKMMDIPFKPVTLSFRDICYDVAASRSKQTLRLLHNVNGIFRPGRMCALMGSSGSGKTTLMDVIALRKQRSGVVTGSVFLNGWPQEKHSFRRCSGYVPQFDVQHPLLTIRETIKFSAKLRLDPKLVRSESEIDAFVDQLMVSKEIIYPARYACAACPLLLKYFPTFIAALGTRRTFCTPR